MQTKTKFFHLILFFILISSCTSNDQRTNSLEGIWKSVGYGKILKINSTTYEFFDITSISCLPSKKGDISEIKNSMELTNDTLFIKSGFSVYYYTRINEFPNLYQQSQSKANDISYNFEVFAETYKNHYAYFELNKLNWDSLYKNSKEKITSKTTEVELYLVLQELVDSLKDNHGSIEPTEKVYELIEKQNETDEKSTQQKKYGDFEIAGLVANHFIKESPTKDSWILKWGKMDNNIGYIQINAMWMFADLELSDSLVKENGFVPTYLDKFDKLSYEKQIEMEVKGVSSLMDKVMKDLGSTEFMIIDVRFNGGGQDAVGLEVLRHFNKAKKQIASKKAKFENGYTKNTPIYLEPSVKPYTKPIYLLTSQQSASATDMMALGSMEITQLKRIGSHTNGAVSDALQKTLPNGWDFSLSNEIYTDNNDKCYENIGVPVDFEMNYPKDRQTFFRSVANDLEKDKQNILKAIEKLQRK
jgi:carboxyl-terminal processing protease